MWGVVSATLGPPHWHPSGMSFPAFTCQDAALPSWGARPPHLHRNTALSPPLSHVLVPASVHLSLPQSLLPRVPFQVSPETVFWNVLWKHLPLTITASSHLLGRWTWSAFTPPPGGRWASPAFHLLLVELTP